MNQQQENKLYEALASLKTTEEARAFCLDLMTPQEIEAFTGRWQVARELASGKPQRQVSADTGVSIATVTRVNRFLNRGFGGYKLMLERLFNSSHHHPNGLSATG